jgi:hypothetical protein
MLLQLPSIASETVQCVTQLQLPQSPVPLVILSVAVVATAANCTWPKVVRIHVRLSMPCRYRNLCLAYMQLLG